jgi:predicted transcriptional regulator
MSKSMHLAICRVLFGALAAIPLGYFITAVAQGAQGFGPISGWLSHQPGANLEWAAYGAAMGALWHLNSQHAIQLNRGGNAMVTCYIDFMTAKTLKDALRRVETWPEHAQDMLAELALEIDQELREGLYHATPAELAGIDRGLKASREGRFAADDEVEAVIAKHRPA